MNRKIGVILSYIMMIFEVLSTLLLTPFILRVLGQAEYGVYKLSLSITAYLLLLDLGVGNAVTRYISSFRAKGDIDRAQKFLGIVTVFYFIIAIVSVICGIIIVMVFPFAFSKGLNETEIMLSQHLLAITIANIAVTLATTAFNNVIISYERFDVSKGLATIGIIIRMVLTIIVLKAGFGSIGIVSINFGVTVFTRGFYVWYVLKRIKLTPQYHGIEWPFIKEIFLYSSLILLQMIATQINVTIDQILIGTVIPMSSVILAVYGVGTQVTQYFQSIGSAFLGVLMPGIVKLVEKNDNSSLIMNEMVRIGRIIFSILGIIWACFLVCGEQFIILWAGKENSEAYLVAIILMTAYLFIHTESVGTQILWAKNQHREQSYLKLGIVLLNIIITILLIRWKPLIGATIGTFISLLFGDIVIMNIIFKKKLNMDMRVYYIRLFRGIVPCLFCAIIVGYLFKAFLSREWIGLLINIIIIFLVYVSLMMIFGLNEYERKLYKSLFYGIKKITKHRSQQK